MHSTSHKHSQALCIILKHKYTKFKKKLKYCENQQNNSCFARVHDNIGSIQPWLTYFCFVSLFGVDSVYIIRDFFGHHAKKFPFVNTSVAVLRTNTYQLQIQNGIQLIWNLKKSKIKNWFQKLKKRWSSYKSTTFWREKRFSC